MRPTCCRNWRHLTGRAPKAVALTSLTRMESQHALPTCTFCTLERLSAERFSIGLLAYVVLPLEELP